MEPHKETVANRPMSSQPSVYFGEERQKPPKSRLTMKILLEQIEELQKENAQLAKRLLVLEGQMINPLWREENAAAAERTAAEGAGEAAPPDCGIQGADATSAEAVLPAPPVPMQADPPAQAVLPARSALPAPANDGSGGGSLPAVVPQPILPPRSERHPARWKAFWLFSPFSRKRSV